MKVLHIIPGLQKAAGTSVFCGEVCNQMVALGHDVTIAICDSSAANSYPLDQRVRLVPINTVLHSIPTPISDAYALVHIHALWSPILHTVAKWARQNRIPIVWSPHGMITPWAMRNKWWKKQLGWCLYQKRDLQSAALLHATAQSEVDDIRRMGLKNKVVVAPLGVTVCHGEREKRVGKTLLFVSRVQKKKGLPMLLDAWAKLKEVKVNGQGRLWDDRPITEGWTIRIVGPDEDNHVAELMAQCERLGLSFSTSTPSTYTSIRPSVEFVGPKYGDELIREYASANLFVLPTHSENFGSVVIESLAQGVPVACTKGAPWEELETHHCGIWCDIGADTLVESLTKLLKLPASELQAMGQRGRRLVEEKYTWGAVGKIMDNAYRGIVYAG